MLIDRGMIIAALSKNVAIRIAVCPLAIIDSCPLSFFLQLTEK